MLDDKSPMWPVGWTSALILLNWLCGNRPVILSIGAETVTHTLTSFLVRFCYSLATMCTCRDHESAKILEHLGVPWKKIRVTRDAVFAIDQSALPARRLSRTRNVGDVCIVVARDQRRPLASFDRLAALAPALLKQGFVVRLLAHDLRPEYDLGLLYSLVNRLPKHPNMRCSQPKTVEEVFELYSSTDIVISARMHPLILVSLAGAIPIGILGSVKVRSLISNLKIPHLSEQSEQVLDDCGFIEKILREKESTQAEIAARLEVFRQDVRRVTTEALTA